MAELLRLTLVWLREQVKPPEGETPDVRATEPEKPFRLVKVIVDVPVAGPLTVTVLGLAEMLKSWTVTLTVAEWDSPAGPEPATVTL